MNFQIIAHRTNTQEKVLEAIQKGYGVEVDVRVRGNRLVCDHAPFSNDIKSDFTFEKFLSLVQFANVPIAINVKEAGLGCKLDTLLFGDMAKRSFVFDLSVPDMREYLKKTSLRLLERISDIEFKSIFELCSNVVGFWIDHFEKPWPWTEADFSSLELYTESDDWNTEIVFVSPELHLFENQVAGYWENIRRRVRNDFFKRIGCERVSICTDHPNQARKYFDEN